jgi:hypothetical protein
MMMEPAKRENLDSILGTEGELAPSSGFVSAVMERVRDEAAAPKPIPFPWKRVLPGAVLAVGGVVWMGVEVARHGATAVSSVGSPIEQFAHVLLQMSGTLEDAAGWVAASLGVSLLSWLMARRMIGRSGLI